MCINRLSFNSLKRVVLMAVGLLMALAVSAQTETIRTVGGKTTYANPPQSPKNNSYKVTKVIRSRESTIVHFYINEHKHSLSSVWTELIDEDTDKRYKVRKELNYTSNYEYSGPFTYKIEFPPLPRDVSEVHLYATPYHVFSIQLPPPPPVRRKHRYHYM